LSEISHLFLSYIRDAASNGMPRPQRTPPKANVSMDLTPEEYAQVFGAEAQTDGTPAQHLDAGAHRARSPRSSARTSAARSSTA
jgi:hypothetical protein